MSNGRVTNLARAALEVAVVGGTAVAIVIVMADLARLLYLGTFGIGLSTSNLRDPVYQGSAAIIGYLFALGYVTRARSTRAKSYILDTFLSLPRNQALGALGIATMMIPFIAVAMWCVLILLLVVSVALGREVA